MAVGLRIFFFLSVGAFFLNYAGCSPPFTLKKSKGNKDTTRHKLTTNTRDRDEWLSKTTSNIFAKLVNATFEAQSSGLCRLPYISPDISEELFRKLSYEPDAKYNASGLISSKGYPVEDYEVPTTDGFLLGMQRIPHGKNNSHITGPRPAVLLQHGLLACSTNWVANPANESLGFILADAGYDVWLGNVRGNTYSKKHLYLNVTQREFWYWSWDEMAKYDLPAMVDFILNTTGLKQISYVGHSQGTTMGFAGLSTNKDLQSKVNLFVGLGPVANTSHIIYYIRDLAHPVIYEPIVETLDLLHRYEFLPNTPLSELLANTVCADEYTVIICQAIFFIMGGYSCQHMNASRIPVYASNGPAGTSIWNVEHWAQMTAYGQFAMFDYGPDGNMVHYNQTKPPLYNVTEIDIPVALFYGGNDILADTRDVEELIPQLKNLVFKHKIDTYGHQDFIWAFDAVDYVYKDILKLLKTVT